MAKFVTTCTCPWTEWSPTVCVCLEPLKGPAGCAISAARTLLTSLPSKRYSHTPCDILGLLLFSHAFCRDLTGGSPYFNLNIPTLLAQTSLAVSAIRSCVHLANIYVTTTTTCIVHRSTISNYCRCLHKVNYQKIWQHCLSLTFWCPLPCPSAEEAKLLRRS